MQPTRNTQATLVDLLERILDKGLILNADVIINVAGIPLLGINLKAALAGMETMLKYGIWQDWDEAQRAFAAQEMRVKGGKALPLGSGEQVVLKVFASYWYSNGIIRTWRRGHLYVTSERIFIFRKEPPEILFEVPLADIESITIEKRKGITGKETNYLHLLHRSGEVAQIHSADADVVKEAIMGQLDKLGIKPENEPIAVLEASSTATRHTARVPGVRNIDFMRS